MTELWWEVDEGDGPPIVLLHEGAGSSEVWRKVRPHLASVGRRVVVYDRRGFGRSAHEDVWTPAHFDAAADDLAQLLGQVADEPVDLLGHSDGGSVALLAAARRPALVRSVVVVATHVRADAGTVAGLRELGRPADWDERVCERYAREHGADWETVVGGWLDLWTKGALDDWDLRPELMRIGCPVLVVHDRRDPLGPPEHAEAIRDRVPTSTVRWYDVGSHRPHLAALDDFMVEVRAFWDRVSRET